MKQGQTKTRMHKISLQTEQGQQKTDVLSQGQIKDTQGQKKGEPGIRTMVERICRIRLHV